MKHHPKKIISAAAFFTVCLICSHGVLAAERSALAEQVYLYKATFVRAAPGKLLDLIALYKESTAAYNASGDERPFWWRHTQGDQWDLMLLFPMGSYAGYYASERIEKRKKAGENPLFSKEEFLRKFRSCSSWHEDILVFGPALEVVKKAFANTAYYHIEIFIALPGKHKELFKEREMENAYQVATGRPENLIFTRDQGASWDLFTLGCYRDLQHWAESPAVSPEERDKAARQAGFAGADQIGPYMRTLILLHRDTMGVAIK